LTVFKAVSGPFSCIIN